MRIARFGVKRCGLAVWATCLLTAFLLTAGVCSFVPPRGVAAAENQAKPAAKDEKADPVTPGDVLSFRQAKVAAEMTELEERMYRLSEALKALEPENSSRLMLGLKFAREELILHQMKDAQQMLGTLSLGEAAVEEKQLLSKLQRLHDLLLATDLDFHVQMERLRQIREALRRLDKAIKEEARERQSSQATADKQKEVEGLRKKLASLAELIAQQKGETENAEKLAALEKEREAAEKASRRAAEELKQANFAAMQRDQAQNRRLNEGITQLVRDLGESGAGALGELLRASGSMSGAEGQLGNQQAGPAGEMQQQALDSLKYAKEQLEEEAEKLLEQLRAEVKRRVMEGLTLMLEKQTAVRESTELVGPKAAAGSRQALTALTGLGKSQGRIVEMSNELITLVEETEFGIALPAALLMVRDAMLAVQDSLAEGDGSAKVVAAEKQIESDLQALLDAMKQLPVAKMSNRKAQRGPRDRQRELNRLIAELKMIRLLQMRTNQRTATVDESRAKVQSLSAAIKDEIEAVADQQDFVREATERLAEERGDELSGGM